MVFMLIVITSCVPAYIPSTREVQQPTFISSTQKSTQMPTSLPTSTAIPTKTSTPLPVCKDQDFIDFNQPGKPEQTSRKNGKGRGFLKYDEESFDIYQKIIHNRTLTVAIQKGFKGSKETDEVVFSNYIFNTWANFWDEFEGFPFSSYTIMVGENLPFDADVTHAGEFGIGFESSHALGPSEYWSHGIYHAWVGNGFRQNNDARWLMEGFTEYNGIRLSGDGNYNGYLADIYRKYKAILDAGRDVPLASINGQSNPSHPNTDNLHYWKGGLVAYMMDLELKKSGHHIGEVARDLYLNYGINSEGHPTDKKILETINKVSGMDFTEFFRKYIFGTDPLPLDPSNFVWVCHDSNVFVLPIPEPSPIPSLPYTIDGYKSDWKGLVFRKDARGDAISENIDIIGYSVIEDDNFIDIFLETMAPITQNVAALDIGIIGKTKIGVNNGFSINVNSDGSTFGGNYPETWAPLLGITVFWKDVVEIQIPKKVFTEFEFDSIKYISLFTEVNGKWVSVDYIN
jgi:hypothetical protein